MMLNNIRSLKWASTEHSSVDLLGTHPLYGEIPFTASPRDCEAYGRDIYARAVAGEFGPIEEYVAPTPTTAQLVAAIEKQRDDALSAGFLHNGFLYHCDPTFQGQVGDYILGYMTGLISPTTQKLIRRKDNTSVMMGQAEISSLAVALIAHVEGIYTQSWVAKDAL
jgi:hypothetical protein